MLYSYTPDAFAAARGLDIKTSCEVLSIDPYKKQIMLKDGKNGVAASAAYRKLIIATGGRARVPAVSGDPSGLLTLRTLADADKIKHRLMNMPSGKAAVIGASFLGLAMAEVISHYGMQVTVFDEGGSFFGGTSDKISCEIKEYINIHNVKLEMNSSALAYDGSSLFYRGGGGESSLDCGLLFIAAGTEPESSLAASAGIETAENKAIDVSLKMETSASSVYACGDCAMMRDFVTGLRVYLPTAGNANRTGRFAADAAAGVKTRFPGVMNASAARIFDREYARTGPSPEMLDKKGMPYLQSFTKGAVKASYMPAEDRDIFINIIYSPEGLIYGAEIFGAPGSAKRIDLITEAVYARNTLNDMLYMDFAYNPNLSPSWEPVQQALHIAEARRKSSF